MAWYFWYFSILIGSKPDLKEEEEDDDDNGSD